MAFGADAIALVTTGLIYDSGSFAERLVSSGLIGDITATAAGLTKNVSGNPFKITGTTDVAEKILDTEVMIQGILWTGATTDGHLCSLTDKAGRQLWKGKMATTKLGEDIYEWFPRGLYSSDGIYVNDIDSGELYIYVK